MSGLGQCIAIGSCVGLAVSPVAFTPAHATETLSVCLEKNSAPLSWTSGSEQGGFDLMVAESAAKRMRVELTVQWFALAGQPESDKVPDAAFEDALLSDGRCQLIGGYALLSNMLGAPSPNHSRLPAFDGESYQDRDRDVALKDVAGSRGYYFLGMTILLAPGTRSRPVHDLNDIGDISVGVEEGTLGDALLQNFRHGVLMPNVHEFLPQVAFDRGGGILDRLERRDLAAVFIETNAFDSYRSSHPATKIVTTGYIHPVGFNLGFVGLAINAPLLKRIDQAIEELLSSGELPTLAARAGLTYVPPRQPDARSISLSDLVDHQ